VRFIGLIGAKYAGKDTVGQMIIECDPTFRRVAFADVLKEMALGIDPFVLLGPQDDGYQHFGSLANLVDTFGWDHAKAIPDVRRFLQRLGTEGGRHCIGENVWVNATFDRYVWPHLRTEDPNYDEINFVFTDVRFPNEIDMVRNRDDGQIWRVDRPQIDDGDTHASERAWRDCSPDYVIDNSGDLEALRKQVEHVLSLPHPLTRDD
jgi:hypothetical protein